MATPSKNLQEPSMRAKLCSRRQRNGLEPLVPGAAIRLSGTQVSSILHSDNIDPEGRIILEGHINVVRDTGKVELGSLLNRLRGEVANLDSKLVNTNDCIKEHLASVAELEAQLKTLEDKRNKVVQLHDHVDTFAFTIPTILPSEILGEIFIACLPERPRPLMTEAPLLLCRVCTTWRKTALNTPQLWSFMTLVRTKDVANLPHVAEKWFSLSGALPLSLRFDIGSCEHTPDYSHSPPTHGVWSRLSNLEISVSYNHYAKLILRNAQPMLNFSKLKRISMRTDFPLHPNVLGPHTFPNLRKLILSYKFPNFDHSDIMAFTKLTHLCVSGSWLSAQAWSVMIRQCTELQHGSFVISTLSDNPVVVGRATTLENLLTLKIVLHTFGYPKMMDSLHFPSLQSLSIGCVKSCGAWHPRFLSPVRFGQLRSLVLYRLKFSIKTLLDLLRSTTRLDSLVIDLPIRTSEFFEAIAIKQQPSDILLMLTKLTVFHSHGFQNKGTNVFDAVCFVHMVKSRWRAVSTDDRRRLSMVSVRTKVEDVQVDRAPRLLSRQLQEGLVLRIGVSPHGLRVATDVSW